MARHKRPQWFQKRIRKLEKQEEERTKQNLIRLEKEKRKMNIENKSIKIKIYYLCLPFETNINN